MRGLVLFNSLVTCDQLEKKVMFSVSRRLQKLTACFVPTVKCLSAVAM